MYKLYIWYAWEMGKWQIQGEFKTKADAFRCIQKKFATFVLTKDDEVVETGRTQHFREGMIIPKKMPKVGEFFMTDDVFLGEYERA